MSEVDNMAGPTKVSRLENGSEVGKMEKQITGSQNGKVNQRMARWKEWIS